MEGRKNDQLIDSFSSANNISTYQSCLETNMPDFRTYTSALDIYVICIMVVCIVGVFITLLTYVDTLRYVLKYSSPRSKTPTTVIVSAYPVVAVVSLCGILVPRAYLLTEFTGQGMFSCGMYHLFCLYVTYCGGENELIRIIKSKTINPKSLPCCCWPCCIFPRVVVNKTSLRLLRLLILQLPVVQGISYLIILVVWAENQVTYQMNFAFIQPMIIVSILIAVWALVMLINLIEDSLHPCHSLKGKFIALKLVPISSSMFGVLAKVLVETNVFPCYPPFTPVVFGNLMYNCILLLEMIILGFWARSLYKRPLPRTNVWQIEIQEDSPVPPI